MAALLAIGVLVLAHVMAWQVLEMYVHPIYATLILLGIDLVLVAIFAVLAARSSPGESEREALRIRQQALLEARGSLALSTLVPLASTLIRASRERPGERKRSIFRRLQR